MSVLRPAIASAVRTKWDPFSAHVNPASICHNQQNPALVSFYVCI